MEELNPQMPEGGAEESQGIKTAKKVIKTIVIILIILVAAAAVYYLYLSNSTRKCSLTIQPSTAWTSAA